MQKTLDTVQIPEKATGALGFLYNNAFGRVLLRLLISRWLSRLTGFFLDRRFSKCFIGKLVKSGNIDLSQYPEKDWRSFNDFFSRPVKPQCRPLPEDPKVLMAPCDGKLSVYPIDENTVFEIKHSLYDVASLLEDEALAKEYTGGTCLVFRLSPDNYHRYHFIDSGKLLATKKIKGQLHTVRPIAMDRYKVFLRNAREWALLDTENLGKVIQLEVGAMFVGRIVNGDAETFTRGQEKGKFEYGGSTVVVLLQKDAANLDPIFLENTRNNLETVVQLGTSLGTI